MELELFYNSGFGWICRQCEREMNSADMSTEMHSRLFREGESESKQPALSSRALAKWVDPSQRALVCPRCGITELVDKA